MVAQGLGTGKQHHRPQAGRGGYNSLCTGAAAIQQPHQACRAEHQPDQSLGAQLAQAVVAKAAADVRLDDAHVCPRTPKRLTDDAADDVRNLRGGNDDDAPVFLVGIAAVVFNVAVLHGGGIVPALDLDESGLLNGLLIISLADIRVL